MRLVDASQSYLAAGQCVLPARRAEKRPSIGSWKAYRTRLPTEAEIAAWMGNDPDAICIVCGAISGNLEIIDFDAGGECFDTWESLIPAELFDRLVIEQTPSGGYHVVYRCQTEVCGNMKLAQRRDGEKIVTLIETRGEGGLFLCAPTDGYELIQGDLANPPVLTAEERDILLQAAWDLNEYLPPVVDGPPHSGDVGQRTPSSAGEGLMSADNPHNGDGPPEMGARPGDDFNHRGDVRAVLEQFGWSRTKAGDNEYWCRPGKESGTSATLKDRVFYVFSSNAAPFEPNQAYSPFAVYAMLTCGGDFEGAARSLRESGYGGDSLADSAPGADISGMMRLSVASGDGPPENVALGQTMALCDEQADGLPEIADPGPIPEHLFDVPGLVRQVMDFTLANAPYPNVGLAFCGAMALQSYLCGRKVCDTGDLRPNIYLLALASSGTGKDFPRKVNSRVLFEIGHVNALGDKFASGEGIQDALARTPAMLFQNDEMDGVLRQINLDRENKRESIPNILLTLYTSADAVYPIRVKAGQKEAGSIDQPHLTLFGTATPQYFYESLSQRMLTNGFFARLIIVDIGKRSAGQTPGSARHLPESILQTARWWAEYQPGSRKANLLGVHPEPRPVPCTPEAAEAIDALQRQTEAEYDLAHDRNDEVAKVAWSRTTENASKLALLYACSENHEDPVIGLPAVQWASAFATHQTRRQLFLAANYVAENPFHAECLKVVRKLREAPERQLQHQILLKRMKMKTKDFKELIETLIQRGDVVTTSVQTPGRTGLIYRLNEGVKEGEGR
jgi:hypothetical protein